jgi:hypothetical protein
MRQLLSPLLFPQAIHSGHDPADLDLPQPAYHSRAKIEPYKSIESLGVRLQLADLYEKIELAL